MPVEAGAGVIVLSGDCPVEDAEAVLKLIEASPGRPVDLTRATRVHSAVFQALLGSAATVIGPAGDQFLERWLRRCLGQSGDV